MSDLISRCELFNRLATIAAPPEANDFKAEVYNIIQQMETVDAVAEPTVIRSRTLMTTKDFTEWAKRVRDGNPNVIVIPRESEVVSAESEDRLYIKIYADDEPSVKAEKLYQICGETQNREVAEWLKEYFDPAVWEKEADE